MKWMGRWAGLCVVLALAVVLGACGKKAGTPQNLAQEWKAVADAALKDSRKQADVGKAIGLAKQMAGTGPEGINPLLDILADPQENPRTKMLVTISITPVVAKENLVRIAELTDAKYEVNTRVNAAHLVASYNDESLNKRAMELLKDPEPRVRMAVLNMQLMRGVPEAIAAVEEAWKDPKLSAGERGQLVNGLPEKEAPKHLGLLAEALGNAQLDPQTRGRALRLLGQFGDASSLAAMEKAAKEDPDPEMRKAAQQAWEAAKSRLEAGGTSVAPATQAAGAATAPETPAPETPAPAAAAAAAPAGTPAAATAATPAEVAEFLKGRPLVGGSAPLPGAPPAAEPKK